jgi:SAM-dependent methyltransferase
MTMSSAVPAGQRWSFWAPASEALIEAALDLAGIRPGDRFLDLGCGDGRALVAAVRRGANVRGIEIDAALAEASRRNLREAGMQGDVELGDMFAVSLDAEVIYAYLTPATLGKLRPVLGRCRDGTRVVTARYRVGGWEHDAAAGQCYLYQLPPKIEAPPGRLGWPSRGVVVVLPAGRRCLVPLSLAAGPGAVALELDGPLSRSAYHVLGADRLERAGHVAVDLVFQALGPGSAVAGAVRAREGEITVAAVFANDGFGQWPFEASQGLEFRRTLDAKIAAARGIAQ